MSANGKELIFFGTDGIRGNAKTLLNNQLVRKVGFWCGQVLPEKGPVLIGADSRLSSNRISSELAAGLSSAGREVWLIGLCPTPAIPFLVRKHNLSGGLMISASHNPPQDNGIKIFDFNGEKICVEKQSIIDQGINKKDQVIDCKTKLSYKICHDLLEEYINSLLQTINSDCLKDTPIVLDLCWGSATSCGEKIFKSLGAKVTSINSDPNGNRINVNCGSTNLEHIKKAVIETNSEMGFAFDGDADRVIAIDSKGRIIDGDHMLFLWGSYLESTQMLQEKHLVATVMSNLGFEKAWRKKGGKLSRTSVGDKYVYEEMVRSKANLGGEQSGHILSTINGLRGDGIFTALQLSNICHKKGINFFEWLNESFKPYPQRLINIPIANNITNERLEASEAFQNSIEKAKSQLQGDGRILIRKSGTEPLLRIMVESIDYLLLNSIINNLEKIALKEFALSSTK